MVFYDSPKKGEYFAQVLNTDILNVDLTDGEFRVYVYYLSHHSSFVPSLSKTTVHFKGIKTERTIEEINKSLIKKGYLSIVQKKEFHYFVGSSKVQQSYIEYKEYFEKKAKRSKTQSERMKIKTTLTRENRLKGARKKKDNC